MKSGLLNIWEVLHLNEFNASNRINGIYDIIAFKHLNTFKNLKSFKYKTLK